MQFLRRVTVNLQKDYLASTRTYGTRSMAGGGSRKSKEERFELVMEFVAKYQDSHNGEFPGITIVRKEVGGSYGTLKEILHGLENMKQAGKLEGSSSVIFSASAKESATQRDSTKALKNCTNMTRDGCVTDRTTETMERRAESRGFGLDASQHSKVDNECNATDSKENLELPQQTTVSAVAPGDSKLLVEFPLFLRGVSEHTTCKDLREAFQDCGEIWNASTLRCYVSRKASRVDAIINFKSEEALKAARMKETVLLRGQAVNVNSNILKSTECEVKQVKAPS